eukprot:7194348-Heterocapsa_arctica.AAC.1
MSLLYALLPFLSSVPRPFILSLPLAPSFTLLLCVHKDEKHVAYLVVRGGMEGSQFESISRYGKRACGSPRAAQPAQSQQRTLLLCEG